MHRALSALRRFRALSDQARATAYPCPRHSSRARGGERTRFHPGSGGYSWAIRKSTSSAAARKPIIQRSALSAAISSPDGIVGDLGGGSLELVDIVNKEIGDGITLPIGGLRLSEAAEGSLTRARKIVRTNLEAATLLANGQDRTFYAVGGTWRNLAKLHMELTEYPLLMTQGYELPVADVIDFLNGIEKNGATKGEAMRAVSRNRRSLLPFGAVAMAEILRAMRPQKVSFSALGVREGFLYSQLDEKEKALDPLISAANELAILRSRSPEHARELTGWTEKAFKAFGVMETVEEARYRNAACLLADISWRAHPDYRGSQSLNLIANGTYGGITHAGRAYIALANYYRFEGLRGDGLSEEIAAIATPRLQQFAKLLGGLLRVSYLFSASMPGVTPSIRFEPTGPDELVLMIPGHLKEFAGERLEGRLLQLSRLTGKTVTFEIET